MLSAKKLHASIVENQLKKTLICVLFLFVVKIDKDKQLVVLDEEHEVC